MLWMYSIQPLIFSCLLKERKTGRMTQTRGKGEKKVNINSMKFNTCTFKKSLNITISSEAEEDDEYDGNYFFN